MKKAIVFILTTICILTLCSCSIKSTSNKSSYDYDKEYGYTAPNKSTTNKGSYDYDKGYGYTAPKDGQSFSDYVKEQDPDLYNSLFK